MSKRLRPSLRVQNADLMTYAPEGIRPASGPSVGTQGLVALLLVFGLFFNSLPNRASGSETLVIYNDYGGLLHKRLSQLEVLRRSGQRVEIRGQHCYSTCTLFLALPNACISPETLFGFHGPSRSGARLQPSVFEKYSRLIANHYPRKLRNWYLRKGRTRIDGLYKMAGHRLVRMGAKSC